MDFRHTDAGLVNLNYQSTPAPPQFPILCASAIALRQQPRGLAVPDDLGHALAGAGRAAGQGHDLERRSAAPTTTSTAGNRYLGHERVNVPAFPAASTRRRSQSVVTQAGALGDPFGSGVRTVWWVYGVGPVQDRLPAHGRRDVASRSCRRTTLAPLPLPSDANLLPLTLGDVSRFRWRNDKPHEALVGAALRGRAAWPTTRRGSTCATSPGRSTSTRRYVFTSRLGGLTNVTSVLPARERRSVDSCRSWARRTGRRAGGASSRPTT